MPRAMVILVPTFKMGKKEEGTSDPAPLPNPTFRPDGGARKPTASLFSTVFQLSGFELKDKIEFI
jgi:hypothetical protein